MTPTHKPVTCKSCKNEFTPQLSLAGLIVSGYCNSCRYEREFAKRKEQAAQRNSREPISDKTALKSKIRAISDKQNDKNTLLAKIKKKLPSCCVIPGCNWAGTDLCHLLAKSLYPEYYTKEENLVRMCRKHHSLFDDNKEFRQKQTLLFNQVASFDERAAIKYFDYADNLRTDTVQV